MTGTTFLGTTEDCTEFAPISNLMSWLKWKQKASVLQRAGREWLISLLFLLSLAAEFSLNKMLTIVACFLIAAGLLKLETFLVFQGHSQHREAPAAPAHWPAPPRSAKHSTPSSELYQQYILNAVFTTLSGYFHLSTSVWQSLLSSHSPVSLGECSGLFTGRYPVAALRGKDRAGGTALQRSRPAGA